ncbi:hypothetical protein L6164_030065 [Bauhinia variegata]|uniref:Uncharacterized protein n=1 Tax=Bauhinia variegata TaxID=167791 RepID=A0ACB9LAL4_BAUVA|nr:hypothetical protein L6164_030065 [Bauhinia variegata]
MIIIYIWAKLNHSTGASNSKLAIFWLEATFRVLQNHETVGDRLPAQKARSYAVFDASLLLQGPLQKVGQDGDENLLAVAQNVKVLQLVCSII